MDKAHQAVKDVSDDKATVIDVRTTEEVASEGIAEGALHIPSSRILDEDFKLDLPRDSVIYTYCRSGGRAGRVKNKLIDMGFKNVINIGGLKDWQNAGGKVVKKSKHAHYFK